MQKTLLLGSPKAKLSRTENPTILSILRKRNFAYFKSSMSKNLRQLALLKARRDRDEIRRRIKRLVINDSKKSTAGG